MKLRILLLGISALLLSCGEETVPKVTNPADYNNYLLNAEKPGQKEALNEVRFWSQRLRPDSSGVGDLGPLAAAYTALFDATGNSENLYSGEKLYKKAMAISANHPDIYARALARNYISQHRFREAAKILTETYNDPNSEKRPTELMLFDVFMELGRFEEAEEVLKKVQNTSDYNYLIRKAKWSDYVGDLDEAINYMEDAKAIAESRDSKGLKIWTYSNLGDYYGHAGRIDDAYEHYLKTLALEPDNAYVLKGIAWIAYSHEKNVPEARRIITELMKNHSIPDYYLLLAELAEYEDDSVEAEAQIEMFLEAVEKGNFGAMYNAYHIEILADRNPEEAIRLAEKEVQNRATPETYHLLALANLKAGNPETALDIIETEVEGKTYEPMAQYHSALVYKANGLDDRLKTAKDELSEAAFELGPVLAAKIEEL